MASGEAEGGRWRPLAVLWTSLSLMLHMGLAYTFVSSATCTPDPMGSQEIELDIMAPRLAPPLRVNGTARDFSRGDVDPEPGRRPMAPHGAQKKRPGAVERQRSQQPHLASSRAISQRERRELSKRHAQREPAKRHAQREPAKRHAQREPAKRHAQREPSTQRKSPEQTENDLLQTMAAVNPEGEIPFHVAQAAKQERQRRRAVQAEHLALARASDARVQSTLARMNASARMAEVGETLGGRGRGRGSLPRIGLRFYLSGRRVASSRVVRPPEPIRLPRGICSVRRLGMSPTTVRMLVSKDGDVTVAYIKRPSGDGRFDRCARKMAREMLFRPGEDLAGHPLNVWIHLIVEARVRPTAVAGAPLGG